MLRGTEETACASQRGSHLRADFFHYRLEKRLILLILRSPSFHSRHTFLLLKSHSLWYSLWQAEQAKTGMHCRCPFQCCWMVIFRFILAVFCMSPNLSQYCDDLLWPSVWVLYHLATNHHKIRRRAANMCFAQLLRVSIPERHHLGGSCLGWLRMPQQKLAVVDNHPPSLCMWLLVWEKVF